MSSLAEEHHPTLEGGHLRLVTFNLQVGIQTSAYHHYLTRSWQHLLPHPQRQRRLDMMAEVLSHFDMVGLQEVDGGSFRSSQVNQLTYLARQGGFPHHYQQLNRNLGRIAQHSNGLLSRLTPSRIEEHRLPGTLPGRGAIHARFGEGPEALHLFVAHLALGQRTQNLQLDYLSELIQPLKHVVVMGDLNCTPERLHAHDRFCASLPLHPVHPPLSYPSWRPSRALDHILLSSSLEADEVEVLDRLFSDHLPVAVDIRLPDPCLKAIRACHSQQLA
ncbi:endonuclease/exonuclease/phosphatase family protein [Halomonas denitrificans]|uniref:endonuclease/exonuclease/phosphatase family protein n=1 Tax=Halomonas TaxID=2745 RepID=UPI001A8F638E|nr:MULTISPECIES: endonuclease/exonuclease/phosphatase family protein [Halomonas]MED5296587.1 endonuclease/exonuclease/phosphatase family protein [Pseudomonadota bacterium]MBN8412933.1 endonuclease/exonuclease/phosphatase family protein [Halomonas litopenaei]MBY5925249.1 endonuclease/exonuclease/phosphatase family protein [Halomonas sp. DP4Y7-2]MBY5929063.1 endonuclease/exonuclease/phosphatase family protein [Halomonas sp. DP8Y7-3]MBY5983649.1 endonuclease/exonuclease/phosphatase family protein